MTVCSRVQSFLLVNRILHHLESVCAKFVFESENI